ncbi:hypothetical protein [Mycobacterium sp. NPDC050853]|uniref:hypothetical protein n=1 Tax=Mycobacterium sp. NPDC050853 TaxID=3155160 RepID=UPI0033E32D9E
METLATGPKTVSELMDVTGLSESDINGAVRRTWELVRAPDDDDPFDESIPTLRLRD